MASVKEIEDLLSQAGGAHHIFEQTTLKGVYDKEWPTWYAQWSIEHGLNTLLGSSWNIEDLAKALDEINERHKKSAAGLSWAEFTAQELMKRAK